MLFESRAPSPAITAFAARQNDAMGGCTSNSHLEPGVRLPKDHFHTCHVSCVPFALCKIVPQLGPSLVWPKSMDKPSDLASPPSALGAPGRGRNGRLQACEPCRKRKVSCDHGVPICRRCRARNNAGDCVYLAPEQKTPSGGRKPTPRRVSTVREEGGTRSVPGLARL